MSRHRAHLHIARGAGYAGVDVPRLMGPSLVAPAAPRRSSRPEMPSAVGLTQHRFMAALGVDLHQWKPVDCARATDAVACSVAAVSVRSRSRVQGRLLSRPRRRRQSCSSRWVVQPRPTRPMVLPMMHRFCSAPVETHGQTFGHLQPRHRLANREVLEIDSGLVRRAQHHLNAIVPIRGDPGVTGNHRRDDRRDRRDHCTNRRPHGR
jgi:hypothetical protein